MEIRRNGVSHVNLNTLISIAGIVFIAGGGWVKLSSLGEELKEQTYRTRVMAEELTIVKEKVSQLEKSVDNQSRAIRQQGSEDRRWRSGSRKRDR
jgi:hypothetical protein